MTDVILHGDGAVTVVAPGFSAAAERRALAARGVACRLVDRTDLKDQPERIAAARADAMARLRRRRDARLRALDIEQALAVGGFHPTGRTAAGIETEKQRLRDLPAAVGRRGDLAAKDADALDAYLPPELEDG